MQRQAVVAGQFYPGNPLQLKADLGRMICSSESKIKALGVISPHAGYMYSGDIAGKLFGSIRVPASVLIIGPNHQGLGAGAALYPDGEWVTPLGTVAINSLLNSCIKKHAKLVSEDTLAHKLEHSLEVQVPFLQYLRPDVRISALCLGHGDFSQLFELGEGIAAAITEYGEDVLIVASSDMTHYESAVTARLKDNMALERVLALDPEGLLHTCRATHITMCGVVPAAVMLVATKKLGAVKAEVVCYGNSGDKSGDMDKVVGYAGVAVS